MLVKLQPKTYVISLRTQTHNALVVDKLMGSRVVDWGYSNPPMVSLNASSLIQSSTNGNNERQRSSHMIS
jgi:hypothetical protein